MGDSKLYTAHDIEKLKQKIATYKDTLTSLKTGSSIDGYRFIKNEFNGFKSQISHLEGLAEIMDEKQSVQIGEYEQQVKQFSVQINSLNQTVEELNQDISLIRNKIKNDTSNNFIKHINAQVAVQESVIIADKEKWVESFIEETTQTEDQTSISSIQQSNQPPSFMQLQSLVAKATNILEAPSDVTAVSSLAIHKKYPEVQQYNKKSFPFTGADPSQLYNGRNSNAPMTSAIQLNKFVKKQRIPIRVIENSALSSVTTVYEKNEKVEEYFDEVNNIAPIEIVNAPIESSDGVSDVASIEVVNSPFEDSDEVNDVAPIEVVNFPFESSDGVSDAAPNEVVNSSIESSDEVNDVAPIQVVDSPFESSNEVDNVTPIKSNEMKRQQHKNKETFWLFNLFSKNQ